VKYRDPSPYFVLQHVKQIDTRYYAPVLRIKSISSRSFRQNLKEGRSAKNSPHKNESTTVTWQANGNIQTMDNVSLLIARQSVQPFNIAAEISSPFASTVFRTRYGVSPYLCSSRGRLRWLDSADSVMAATYHSLWLKPSFSLSG
jgi:hypothetical protein